MFQASHCSSTCVAGTLGGLWKCIATDNNHVVGSIAATGQMARNCTPATPPNTIAQHSTAQHSTPPTRPAPEGKGWGLHPGKMGSGR